MKVLLGFDGSAQADLAVRLVRSIAWPAGSTIRVMSVIQPVLDAAFSMPGMVTTPDALDRLAKGARAEANRSTALVAAELRTDDRTVEERVFEGRPATAIIDMARDFDPDLVVVGSHGRGQIAAAVLGSVSAEVAESVHCSVLVVRAPSISTLLLADDGSPDAAIAERLVARMPGFRGMRVRVVTVEEHTTNWFGWLEPESAGAVQRLEDDLALDRERQERALQQAVDRLNAAGLVATSEIRTGRASHEIVAASKGFGADVIVMGTRGQSGLTRLLLGGVARSVLQHAQCSVLIVRGRPAEGSVEPTSG